MRASTGAPARSRRVRCGCSIRSEWRAISASRAAQFAGSRSPTGPFGGLPMNDAKLGHRSGIVWSVPEDDAAGWLSLDDEDFAAEAQAAMGGFLGKVEMLAPRSTFPLGFHHAAQITARRLALVGDAAHAIHPIAGQGLNLGFRDVAALAEVLVEGSPPGPAP